MNCARCGTQLQPGTSVCPACGEPVNAWPQQGVYQQSYVQYQQGQYPQGYQTPYTYGSRQPHDDGGFLGALSDLPRAFADSFSRPAEVMRGLVERRDRFSWLIVSALVLVLAFLCGMVLMRGVLGMMLRAISVLSNTPLASTDASMSQGVSYIAGRVGPMAGGVAALCQLISMAALGTVFMVYLGAVCHVALSYELVSGFVTVISLNTAATTVLAMACSLLSPWLALMVMACGLMIGIIKACGMLSLITGKPESQLFASRLILSVSAVLAVLGINGVVGGLLMNGVLQRILGLLVSAGALI